MPIIPFVPKERNKTRIFCIETNTFYDSIHEAADLLEIDRRSLQRALNQERNGINGLHFVRESEMEKIPEIIKKQTGSGKKIYCLETK